MADEIIRLDYSAEDIGDNIDEVRTARGEYDSLDERLDEIEGGGFTPTQAQLAAMNSGITATRLQTDENNISYIEDKGAKNLIPYPYAQGSPYTQNGITYTADDSGIIHVSGTISGGNSYYGLILTANPKKILIDGETYVLSVKAVGSGLINSVYCNEILTSGVRDMVSINSIGEGIRNFEFTFAESENSSGENLVIKITSTNTNPIDMYLSIMICKKSDWDISHTYQPYAMSNVELTAKEQQNENNILSTAMYGTCDTAGATAAKIVDVPSGFVLRAGCVIGVRFTNSNSASNVTLNVGGSGDKPIRFGGATYTATRNAITGTANNTLFYMYDGGSWNWISFGFYPTQMTASEASAGTSTQDRFISAKVLSDAIDERIQPILAALQANNNRAISDLKSVTETRLATKAIETDEETEQIKR